QTGPSPGQVPAQATAIPLLSLLGGRASGWGLAQLPWHRRYPQDGQGGGTEALQRCRLDPHSTAPAAGGRRVMTRSRCARVWTEAEVRELLRAGRPPDLEDLVIGNCGHWCVSVETYLDAVLRESK